MINPNINILRLSTRAMYKQRRCYSYLVDAQCRCYSALTDEGEKKGVLASVDDDDDVCFAVT